METTSSETYLLDVNVLLALAWPNHLHHEVAHSWMVGKPPRKWATCLVTQAGFVRISCNPNAVGEEVTPRQACEILQKNISLPEHDFWNIDLPLGDSLNQFMDRLVGHRQIMDAYLWGMAAHYGGVLATLDQRIQALVPAHDPLLDSLETIRLS